MSFGVEIGTVFIMAGNWVAGCETACDVSGVKCAYRGTDLWVLLLLVVSVHCAFQPVAQHNTGCTHLAGGCDPTRALLVIPRCIKVALQVYPPPLMIVEAYGMARHADHVTCDCGFNPLVVAAVGKQYVVVGLASVC